VTNSRVKRVKSFENQWTVAAFFKNILDASEDNSFGRMLIDRNGTKWMATNRDGVVGFNESNNTFKKNTIGTDTGNLPASDVRALAIDNRNQLWIGTIKACSIA
jgi:ligand-binding sensor domain-containing protein